MNISTQTRYAIRLLFALREPGPPVSSAVLAEQIGISLQTLERVHIKLKTHSITDGTVGARGGIFLCRSLHDISLGLLISIFNGGIQFSVCHGDRGNECPGRNLCPTMPVWREISGEVQTVLDRISLAAILRKYPPESCCFKAAMPLPFQL